MLGLSLKDGAKKARYLANFARRRLVHTNMQLLYDCNFHCRICDFWREKGRNPPRLSAAQVRVLSDRMAEIGPQVVSIGGGEPLLHPELVEVVEALARHHFPVMICNGWFVEEPIARALWRAGIYEVSVSVDYADPARHDAQRGMPGAFERALRALEILARTRVAPHQRVHMISVVMDDNVDDLEALVLRCRELGITYLVTLYSDKRGALPVRRVPNDVGARLLELKRRHPEFVSLRGYVGRFSEAIRAGGLGPCRAGRNLCNIDSQGDVSLCIDRLQEPVGNIFRDEPRLLERRLRARHDGNTCRACWTSCRGSIETLLYGERPLANLWDYHQMTRDAALAERRV
ncbi:MAG TPA: radical SAM protein [Myxococcota bacterium]|nr:radical SAM protein [Myxococcota bacterium]HRY91811.1 radical SAM protein [Myxococcota bacterium]